MGCRATFSLTCNISGGRERGVIGRDELPSENDGKKIGKSAQDNQHENNEGAPVAQQIESP